MKSPQSLIEEARELKLQALPASMLYTNITALTFALADALERSERRREAATRLLEVPGRKMHYLVRDYKDDKESRRWLEDFEAWRQTVAEEGEK